MKKNTGKILVFILLLCLTLGLTNAALAAKSQTVTAKAGKLNTNDVKQVAFTVKGDAAEVFVTLTNNTVVPDGADKSQYAIRLNGVFAGAKQKTKLNKNVLPGQTWESKVSYTKGIYLTKGSYTLSFAAKDQCPVSYAVTITCKYAHEFKLGSEQIVKGKTTTARVSYSDDLTKTWKSSNKKVATVDANGVIKGIGAGMAHITCNLSDGEACSGIVLVFELTPKAKTLKARNTYQFKMLSDGDWSQLATWKSSNKKVATVERGLVKAVGVGTATITAKASGITLSSTVKVTNGLNISTAPTMLVGEQKTVTPVGPTGAATWKSSDPKVVSVTSAGVIKALKKGTAVITCKIANGPTLKSTITVVKTPVTVNTVYGEPYSSVYPKQPYYHITNQSINKTIASVKLKYTIYYKNNSNKTKKITGTAMYTQNINPGTAAEDTDDLRTIFDAHNLSDWPDFVKATYAIQSVTYSDGTTWKP
ncbi:MAG: Ig-like domain-containing protein [Clostridia bacterium]|nr:Ig-like domain-containing protein [Clostridia bacterium]